MHATDASLNGGDGRRLLSSYRHLLGQLMMARELTREQWGEVGMGMDVADRAERELGMVESVLRDFRSNEPTKRLMRVLQNISAVRIQRTWRAKEARIATVPLCMRKYMLIRAGELGVSNVAHIRTMSAGVITTASGGVGAGGKPLPLRGSVAWVHGRIEQMYVNKMAGDLSNDARHLPRRAFPEHIYDRYLAKYGVRVVLECVYWARERESGDSAKTARKHFKFFPRRREAVRGGARDWAVKRVSREHTILCV